MLPEHQQQRERNAEQVDEERDYCVGCADILLDNEPDVVSNPEHKRN
jgi:hypothetical protein